MFTVEIHARGVNNLQEWLRDLELLFLAHKPPYCFRDAPVPSGPRAWDLPMRFDGLEHHEDRQGAMDGLFENLLQVTVNFHADDGGRFTLTERTAGGDGRSLRRGRSMYLR